MRVIICAIIMLLVVNIMPSYAEDSSLFIGLIEDVDGNQIIVDDLFNLDIEAKESDQFIIDVSDIEPTEYPIGYLISIYFTEYTNENGTIIVKAKELSAVEPNGEVTICGTEEPTELFIGKILDVQDQVIEVEPLFDLKNNYDENTKIYLDISSVDTLFEYPVGDIITVEYSNSQLEDNQQTIQVYSVTSVEEDHEVEATVTQPNIFQRIIAFFKMIFNI